MTTSDPFKAGAAARAWTVERLDRLDREELSRLQANAERLGETELAASCGELMKTRPTRGAAKDIGPRASLHLVPRSRAFAARGVHLTDPRSWSGIRKADGTIVIALWKASIELKDGACTYLLWAPNHKGARPWSDTEAGRERLEHCRMAVKGAKAEGLLVHGDALDGRLPEDRAGSVLGIDPGTVISLSVEQRGDEYWAVWGKRQIAP
jgi:hypothetical protein